MTTAVGATASPGAAASSTEVRPPEERHDHRQSAEQRNHDARQSPPDKTTAAVAAALHTGYRQIDAAGAYFNEKPVGEGLRCSGPDHSEVFIETKVWVPDFGRRDPLVVDLHVQRGQEGVQVLRHNMILSPLFSSSRTGPGIGLIRLGRSAG